MFLWNRAIDIWDKNLELHRKLTQQKDEQFLKSVTEITEQFKKSEDIHSQEHKIIWEKIDNHSREIKQKLDHLTNKLK